MGFCLVAEECLYSFWVLHSFSCLVAEKICRNGVSNIWFLIGGPKIIQDIEK